MANDASDRRLIAYTLDQALPPIQPAPVRRDWMDGGQGFPYRCLPLTIANSHGWVVLGECTFDAVWNGGNGANDIAIKMIDQAGPPPLSHFGMGVLTFHVSALFRTPPGINLWVSGPPNTPTDGIAPLSGVVETDWAPMTFTMNWRFTRPFHSVRFTAGEPICFFFPVPRDIVAGMRPETRPLSEDAALHAAHHIWRQQRTSFNADLKRSGSPAQAQGWQRHYHRGQAPAGEGAIHGHATKVQARPFPEVAPG
ncbi:DUF6065 family protein [Roseomonas marmotae]|uniref:DUF2169 domain-containing protein n=1 Tax=Roseomonas marmotae TaxID=2768161 RepID=A0ABS3KAA4_9PROT|nr:DUF6065 family protein [Roseomonas marmotae]MBO1074381.1 hypothetical protein [Roseomonas marmotae]QTI78124.1 hypothetical protein IAI58_10385 [Roseomonas marmotae]